jgi:hypothetical protein
VTRRHSHPRAVEDPTPPPEPSGIDYLGLVAARHHDALEQRIAYVELPDGTLGDGARVDGEDVVVFHRPAWDLAADRPIGDGEEGR